MLKVLIADDHSLFRRGVKDLLIHELGPVTIGECGDTHELLEQIGCKKWDLLIMDIGMPGTTGVEALKRVKAECPELPVIILSMHPEDQYAVRMFKAGASAYLMKASASDELVKAIHKVRGGGQYVSAAQGEKLVLLLHQGTDQPHALLSDREYEVMRLIATGKTISEIAQRLCLGTTTVSTYRARILDKLHLKNNAEIMRYALQHELV